MFTRRLSVVLLIAFTMLAVACSGVKPPSSQNQSISYTDTTRTETFRGHTAKEWAVVFQGQRPRSCQRGRERSRPDGQRLALSS